jgi:hypothetical protein
VSTHRFSVHANLVPIEALFLWADLDRATEWLEGVTRVSDVEGPQARPDFTLPGRRNPLVILPGSRYVLWFRLGPVRHEVVARDDPGSTPGHRTRLDGRFRRGEMRVAFEAEDGGSRVSLEMRTEGLLPSIAGRLLAVGSYRGSFRSQLRSFARAAERERLGRLIL